MAGYCVRAWAVAALMIGCGGSSSPSGSANSQPNAGGQSAGSTAGGTSTGKGGVAGSSKGGSVAVGGRSEMGSGGAPSTGQSSTSITVSVGGTTNTASGGQTTTVIGGTSSTASSTTAIGGAATAGKSATNGSSGGALTGGKSGIGGTSGAPAGGASSGGKSNIAGQVQGPANDEPGQNPFVRSADSGVLITSSDGLNGIELVLAADTHDGLFVAGATRNPQAMGLAAFDTGITSEAFAARLDAQGNLLWSVPLKKCGVPADIAAGPSDSVYVLCPNEPDVTTLMPSSCDAIALVEKLAASNGQLLFEAQVKIPSASADSFLCPYGLGVDTSGRSYVGGLLYEGSNNQRAMVTAVTSAGQQDWTVVAKAADSTTTDSAVAYPNDVDVDANGNVIFAGGFNTWMELGTTRLTSEAKLDQYSMYNGFFGRLSSTGSNATGWKFGGKVFDLAHAIKPTNDGGFIVGGMVSASATIGGKAVNASQDGSAFVARLTSDGQASWAKSLSAKSFALNQALASDDQVHFVGVFDQDELVYTYNPKTDQLTARKTVAGNASSNELRTNGIAISTSGTVWISGTFKGTIDLGTGALTTSTVSAFLWRMH